MRPLYALLGAILGTGVTRGIPAEANLGSNSLTIVADLKRTPAIPRVIRASVEKAGWVALPRHCDSKISFPNGGAKLVIQGVKLLYDRKAVISAGESPVDVCFDVVQVEGEHEFPPHVLGRLAKPLDKVQGLRDRQELELPGLCQVVVSNIPLETVQFYYEARSAKSALRTDEKSLEFVGEESDGLFEAQGVAVSTGTYSKIDKSISMKPDAAIAFFKACRQSTVKFKFNAALPALRSLQREYYLPHWGKFARVNEDYDLQNDAVQMGSPYPASDIHLAMQRVVGTIRKHDRPLQGSPVLFTIDARLPAGARDFEYYDTIGNISTSSVWRRGDGSFRVELEPRHPLFGGWSSAWTLRYHVPASLFEKRLSSGETEVTIPWAPAVEQMWTDRQSVRLILPPKSTVTNIELANDNEDLGVTFGSTRQWFDMFTSRPTVEIVRGPTVLSDVNFPDPVVKVTYVQKRLLSHVLHLLWWPTIAGLLVILFQASSLSYHLLSLLKRAIVKGRVSSELPKIEALAKLGDYLRGQKDLSAAEPTNLSAVLGGTPEDWEQMKSKTAEGVGLARAERRIMNSILSRNHGPFY